MKRMSIRLAVLMVLCLFAFGCTKAPVGVVDVKHVYANSQAAKDGIAYLENLSSQFEAEITTMQKNVESAKDKDAAQAELQQALMGMQQRFASEQQQVMTKITDAFEKARLAVLEKNGFSVLLPEDLPLAYVPSANVTEQVLNEMNAHVVTYSPVEADSAQ